jgi:hypothetical protein
MLLYTIDCPALLMNLLQCELHKVYLLNTHVTWILFEVTSPCRVVVVFTNQRHDAGSQLNVLLWELLVAHTGNK